jgi:hypothetical protein
MPQLIAVGLVALLVWYAWRVFRREMARLGAEAFSREKDNNSSGVTVLEQGKDGVYRPKD